jgi:UDP-glucose 4-epimerase
MFTPNLKVLITGGAGFIGSHLCRRLCSEGSEVHATSRNEHVTSKGGPIWWQADMADLSTARHVLRTIRPDIVYHLAGSVGASPSLDLVLPTYHSLLTSTVNLLVAGTEVGCSRIILSGSYTEPDPMPPSPSSDQIPPSPSSPYGAAKWAASGYGRLFNALCQTPVVILRPFTVYGPAQARSKLIPSTILSLLRGEPPKLSSGKRKADWVFIADVVEGFIAGAKVPGIEGATIDLGSGTLVSIRTVVERLAPIICSKVEPLFGALPDRPGENETVADTAASAALLGWRATTPLESGLQQTVDWYRAD